MSKIKSLSDNADIKNKRIIVRLDFNVPIVNKFIQDKTRIDLCVPFIRKLLNRNAKIFLVSHLGSQAFLPFQCEAALVPIFCFGNGAIGGGGR